MDADQLFAVSGPIAMTGWAVLAVSPLAPRAAQIAAGIAIPAVLSLAYAVLILVAWSDADGGFDSLANVMMLFDSPMVALAGWVHYLAFDLFVGAWVVRRAGCDGVAHILLLPCLLLTFLFGPIGLLLFLAIVAARTLLAPRPIEA